ncbi:MAG: GDP-mannose 4,6-dehydratase [Polynucleobacter sp.]|nr:GDP-mannose 4,6-dehydratase [Polynucleobacter sp.]
MKKRALICGITGQDGALLAKFLINKDYEVWGTSRDAEVPEHKNISRLGIKDAVVLRSVIPSDFRSVLNVLAQSTPDEVYFLGSQSSVSLSFVLPAETIESILNGVLNFLEAIRILKLNSKFFHPSSSECFGNVEQLPATIHTPFNPVSPYGVAKAAAHFLVINYRLAYNVFACNGILFNHESVLRPSRFVTQKIVERAYAISVGKETTLSLGRLDIIRDWGWAPEYVEGMWLSLQQPQAGDYIFATGEPNSLESFVDEVFKSFGLKWQDYVVQEKILFRPSELNVIYGDPTETSKILGWTPKFKMKEVAKQMAKEHAEKFTKTSS